MKCHEALPDIDGHADGRCWPWRPSIFGSFVPWTMSSMVQFFFATGAMPGASLLIVIGLVAVPQLLRSGEISPFVIGFEASGWMSIFGFIAWYSVAPETLPTACSRLLKRLGPPAPLASAASSTCRGFCSNSASSLPCFRCRNCCWRF